jgi:5'-nucleotidase
VLRIERTIKLRFDLDGVLAGFDERYMELTGLSWFERETETQDEKWARILVHPTFFRDLPYVDGALDLWLAFNAYDRGILSAKTWRTPDCEQQKREWCKSKLAIEGEKVIIVADKRDKQKYADPDTILIDDHRKNCEEFEAAGGHVVLFKNSALAYKDICSEIYKIRLRNFNESRLVR